MTTFERTLQTLAIEFTALVGIILFAGLGYLVWSATQNAGDVLNFVRIAGGLICLVFGSIALASSYVAAAEMND